MFLAIATLSPILHDCNLTMAFPTLPFLCFPPASSSVRSRPLLDTPQHEVSVCLALCVKRDITRWQLAINLPLVAKLLNQHSNDHSQKSRSEGHPALFRMVLSCRTSERLGAKSQEVLCLKGEITTPIPAFWLEKLCVSSPNGCVAMTSLDVCSRGV